MTEKLFSDDLNSLLCDNDILKPNEELYEILYDCKLYHDGKMIGDKIRKYAVYFFDKIVEESRELNIQDMILMNDSDTNTHTHNKRNDNDFKRNKKRKN